jgi:DUF971 family protein
MAVLDAPRAEVRVVWSDKHISRFPFAYLRSWCPCVLCVGGHGQPKHFVNRGADPNACRVLKANRQGNYALQFVFGDGHDVGIFDVDFLRGLDAGLNRGVAPGRCGESGCRMPGTVRLRARKPADSADTSR